MEKIEKMYYKKFNCEVNVYEFFDDGTALIFAPYAQKQCNNGWMRVKVSCLLPTEYVLGNKFISKSDRNKIKEKLNLKYAIWECTDKKTFENVDDAIKHQRELKKEG